MYVGGETFYKIMSLPHLSTHSFILCQVFGFLENNVFHVQIKQTYGIRNILKFLNQLSLKEKNHPTPKHKYNTPLKKQLSNTNN